MILVVNYHCYFLVCWQRASSVLNNNMKIKRYSGKKKLLANIQITVNLVTLRVNLNICYAFLSVRLLRYLNVAFLSSAAHK